MSKPAQANQPPPIPRSHTYVRPDGAVANDRWVLRDDVDAGFAAWINDWAVGRSFAEQAVASLILDDFIRASR
jgi:hypothetical protein